MSLLEDLTEELATEFPGLLEPWPPEIFEQATRGLLPQVDMVDLPQLPAIQGMSSAESWTSSMSASTASDHSACDDPAFSSTCSTSPFGPGFEAPLPSVPGFTVEEPMRPRAPVTAAAKPAVPTAAAVVIRGISKDPFTNYREAMEASVKALASENNKTLLDSQWGSGLLQMEVKELNRWLKQANLPVQAVQELKEARRRRKNRMYAKRCRQKRGALDDDQSLAMDKTALRAELHKRQKEIDMLLATQSKAEDFVRRMQAAGKLSRSDMAAFARAVQDSE